MSPYIITTTRALDSNPHTRLVSRRAVATLEEARRAAQDAVDGAGPIKSRHSWEAVCGHVATLPESGGTIGPLPDGTVIEVARMPWYKVAIGADMLPRWQQGADTPRVEKVKTEILDAFNARQS